VVENIVDGIKEVVREVSAGMVKSSQVIFVKISEIYTDIDVKLMGSYEEIEAYEKAKEAVVEIEK
jgi:hypothetical protein